MCAARAQAAQQASQAGEASEDGDVPEEFLDPIMQTLMEDPVLLPDSRTVIDRCPDCQLRGDGI